MSDLQAIAYVSMGVWVTKCPRPWCVHVDHYGPGPNTGRIGGLTEKLWHCFRCELVCEAVWPPAVDDIERLLAARPQPETRNWLPGETVDDLLFENAAHGLLPADGPSRALTTNGRLTPAGLSLVAAGGTLAIGA